MRVSGLLIASLLITTLPSLAGEAAGQRVRTGTEKAARNVQRVFEARRRYQLPRVPPRRDDCDVTIGRLCYWDDNRDARLPAERADVIRDRARLRAALDSLAAADPRSDYILGQRVRYALEASDTAAALAMLGACGATPWWCHALQGLVWHRAAYEERSAAAFDSALALMSDTLRCAWVDVRSWLPPGAHWPKEDAPPCVQRDAVSARLLWLAAPLLTWRPNATRDEFLSRRTMATLLAGTATPHGLAWGPDMAELSLRFGWPDRWARETEAAFTVAPAEIHVVGDEPTPSFDLVPNAKALESPFTAVAADWRSADGDITMRYAPGWLRVLDSLPVQVARFRRAGGESTTVVVVYDARALLPDTVTAAARATALLTASPDTAIAAVAAAALPIGTLVFDAPARPALAAVEVVDTVHAQAARWRAGLAPLAAAALVSDLLVGIASPGLRDLVLDSIQRYAVASPRVTVHDTLALYWETYARPTPGDPARVALRLVPLSAGMLGRIARSLGLAHAAPPLSLTWDDFGAADSSVARSLRVAIPDVPPGRYRIELAVDARGAHSAASREIDVIRLPVPSPTNGTVPSTPP